MLIGGTTIFIENQRIEADYKEQPTGAAHVRLDLQEDGLNVLDLDIFLMTPIARVRMRDALRTILDKLEEPLRDEAAVDMALEPEHGVEHHG